jgi:hypothetical protein
LADGTTKAIDGLVGVADPEEAPASLAGQGLDQGELQFGQVLDLVDQDVPPA